MDRRNYYYGQIVQEDELDVGFANAEQADWDQNSDVGLIGIQIPAYDVPAVWPVLPSSWTVDEAVPPSWKVSIDTGYACNKDGKRMAVDPPTTVELDCQNDYLGNPNAVAAGNERWISIFLKYVKTLSDPRVDDNGVTVYFVETESYELECRQGPEELAPAVTKPALDSTAILIADILIDNGMPPINTADIDLLTRVERLMHLDVSALQPGWYAGGKDTIRGRNLDEIIYALMDILMDVGAGYIDATGTVPMAADFLPDATCTRDMGSSLKLWKRHFVQAVREYPDQVNSGFGLFVPDTNWEAAVAGHRQITKLYGAMGGVFTPEFRDTMGRRHPVMLEDVEDFLQYNTHPGPYPFRFFSGGTGAAALNPAPYGNTQPGGFVDLTTPINGDFIRIYRGAYPIKADYEPACEWGFVPLASSGAEFIFAGLQGASGAAALFGCIYDPSGTLLPAPGATDWWCYYCDGVNPAVWFNVFVPFATTPTICEVAFERNVLDGHLYIWAYVTQIGVSTPQGIDLTALGGTYEANALADAWDVYFWLDASPALAAGEDVVVDWYRNMQFRTY